VTGREINTLGRAAIAAKINRGFLAAEERAFSN
jgi:hypothetical protein